MMSGMILKLLLQKYFRLNLKCICKCAFSMLQIIEKKIFFGWIYKNRWKKKHFFQVEKKIIIEHTFAHAFFFLRTSFDCSGLQFLLPRVVLQLFFFLLQVGLGFFVAAADVLESKKKFINQWCQSVTTTQKWLLKLFQLQLN